MWWWWWVVVVVVVPLLLLLFLGDVEVEVEVVQAVFSKRAVRMQ